MTEIVKRGVAAISVLWLLAGAHTAQAAGVVGTGTAASCTDAALDAALAGGGLVTFDCGGPATIDISTGSGTKVIEADTTVDGGGLVTISGGNQLIGGNRVPVFVVDQGVFTVKALTIADGSGGGIHSSSEGGSVTVSGCSFRGNQGIEGGGIFNRGRLTVDNSTFVGNRTLDCILCSSFGGAIFNAGGTLAVTNSTFSDNTAAFVSGGAIYTEGGTVTVTNSTFSGNSSAIGRGSDPLPLVRNSILANSSADNCANPITDGGHNLDSGTSCGFSAANGSLSNTDPHLDPAGLKDNGGPTETVALCTGVGVPAGCIGASPAIGAGDQAVCAADPVNNLDQRGFVRPGGGRASCSIGAYEADALPGATFTKITDGDIVTIPAWYWNGAWGDYDDDGYLDLFVGATFPSKRNFLYHNNRDGTFTLIDDSAMPKIPSNQHGSAWGDCDNDGHLDLIVTAGNPEVTHNVLYRNNGDGTLSGITTGPIYTETNEHGFHAPSWGDYDNDGFIDLFIAGHDVVNRLFRNDGAGSFTRIIDSPLVNDPANSEGRAWVDYDNDGDLDLFVSNNEPYQNVLYRNGGRGVFTKVTTSGLSERVENTIASCWADYDNDGFLDLFLANAEKNSLYHNDGDGMFTSITDSAVVTDTIPGGTRCLNCAWGDYDNDGFIDLYVSRGDPFVNFSSRGFLYRNEGDGTFAKVTESSVGTDLGGFPNWVDYDNDGFLDLFLSAGALNPVPQICQLHHNDGNGNAWLNVKLVGTVSNRSAIGAKVRVNAFYRGESRWQVRDISGGDSQENQQSLNAEFGLADATSIDTVRVEWPAGSVQELRNVAPRQFLTVTEIPCIGDCDHSGEIRVNELVTLMSIGLGDAPPEACPIPGGATVDIALVVGAVENALSGCLFREE